MDKLAVGFASREAYFEGSLYADTVGEVYAGVIVGVESAEHGSKAFYAFCMEFLLQHAAQFGCWVGKNGYAVA